MPKYYSVPSLYERNVYLQKKIKALKDMNNALKQQVSQLLNDKNQNKSQMLPQPQNKTDVYLYFSYKEQIKQKLQQIKQLQEKCSKIYYHSIFRDLDKQHIDSDGEKDQNHLNQPIDRQKGIMRQSSLRNYRDQDDVEEQINGRKMFKKQSLQQKKEDKKTLQQSKQTIPEILNQMMNEQHHSQSHQNASQGNKKEDNLQKYFTYKASKTHSLVQNKQQDLSNLRLPISEFLKKYYSDQQIPRYYKLLQGKFNDQDHSNNLYLLNLSGKPIVMSEFLKYNWTYVRTLVLNNCSLTSNDWDLLSQNISLFKNLKSLSLKSNRISDIKEIQMQKFKHFRGLSFGSDMKVANPLSQQSINLLQKVQKLQDYKYLALFFYNAKQNKIDQKMDESKSQQNNVHKNQQPQPLNERPAQIPPPQPKVLKQTNCIDYLKNVYRKKAQLLLGPQYGPISQKTKQKYQRTRGIKYSENSFYLSNSLLSQEVHNFQRPKMQEFIKLNWQEFEQMRMSNCKFIDDDWRKFTENSQQYPHLKLLLLNNNKIASVRYEELQKLKQLKYLNFEGNELDQRSKCEIQEFNEKYSGKIKVFY